MIQLNVFIANIYMYIFWLCREHRTKKVCVNKQWADVRWNNKECRPRLNQIKWKLIVNCSLINGYWLYIFRSRSVVMTSCSLILFNSPILTVDLTVCLSYIEHIWIRGSLYNLVFLLSSLKQKRDFFGSVTWKYLYPFPAAIPQINVQYNSSYHFFRTFFYHGIYSL